MDHVLRGVAMNYTISFMLLCFSLFPELAQAKNEYNPVLYNLSTLFDFNPVKGNVKKLNSIVLDGNGVQVYKISIDLNDGGCVDAMNLKNTGDNYTVSLRRDGDFLKGSKNDVPLSIQLDKSCNLISKNEGGDITTYTLDTNGMLKTMSFMGQKMAEHFYDADSNLVRAEFYASGLVASMNNVVYANTTSKPLDYELNNTSSYSQGYKAVNSCSYDEKLVPKLCKLTIQSAGNPAPPLVSMTVHTDVVFF